jgi:pimeloyl-ACP methyl ester carboxylesterase
MARFVLVHGGWHGGWCFRWLARELEHLGHDVAAPDLPCEEIGLTPLDYAREVGPQPDAIVVGHSLAGFTLPYIEARARVYLAALPPLERSEVNKAFVETFGGAVLDSSGRSYWPDADTTAARLYPDCSRAQSDWPSRSSAAKLGSSRSPHHSARATW